MKITKEGAALVGTWIIIGVACLLFWWGVFLFLRWL
jgi:hypothetical protein